ncbi:MAG: chromosome segregation protein SMC [Methanotrichaceae archaeon]|nr:chromosome segregation protein SMC [Methanotrichaceae archaeon]
MFIKEMELRNFKSFGKSIRVPFRNDFITVTGPNGSGKSNIIDALLFALCLSNSRAMRAERLPDLIYRGDNGKNPDFAEVTIRLDNICRSVPIEQDVIEISRRVKLREDKYSSVYYFNGKACGQGELQDKLSGMGITPEGYNIVMQGDVTRIIGMTSLERRKIIDEIAGVAEFDEKKKKAMEELEIVRERIGRLDVILVEVEAQLDKLKEERDKAILYQAQRDELRKQEAFLHLAKLKESLQKLKQLENDYDDLRAGVELHLQMFEQKRSRLSELEERLNGLSSQITNMGEEEQISVKRQIEELKGSIARETSCKELSDVAGSEIERQQKECYLQISKIHQESEKLVERIRDASLRLASLKGELGDQICVLSESKAKIANADVRYSQHMEALSQARDEREEAKSTLSDLIRERDRLLDASRRGNLEREELAAGIADALETLNRSGKEVDELKAELDSLNVNALELERDKDDLEAARSRLKQEISQIERELQRLHNDYARAEGRLRVVDDKSGFSGAVEAVRSAMKRQMLWGLYGTIADLGKVDSRYSTALEVAAGARMQSIVAETDEDAAQAIDYLKRSQIGRATFLPLNKLSKASLPDKPKLAGVVDYALNLVEFDSKFYSAFWYVFRDTLVVEHLSHARQLMGRHRMVTLEGDLVEKSGAMTGGHYKSRIKFAAEESKRLLEISERIAAAEKERNSRLDKLDEIEANIFNIGKQVDELDKSISRKTFKFEELLATHPNLERSIQEKRQRLSDIDLESQSNRDRLAQLDNEIRTIEAILGELEKKLGQIEKELLGSEIPQLTVQADVAEAEIKKLNDRIKDIESEMLKDKLREENDIQRIHELQMRKDALERQKADAIERVRCAQDKIRQLEMDLKSAQERENEISSELLNLKGERGNLLEQFQAAQKEVIRAEHERERIDSRMMIIQAATLETKSVVEALRAEIESCGVDSSQEPPSSSLTAERIKAIEKSMKDLEPVNMLAIDEYERVELRYTNLQDRSTTLSREREAIIEKLERYDQMKKEAFLTSFQEINNHFKEIFMELSEGDGELILENPEDPLNGGMTIKARPAGKSYHRLEAMSGGEKSLMALSFIFAMQMYRPAPFYALDEIDMFLDGVNVERVAKLIKRISRNTQFIVVSLRKPMIQNSRFTLGVTIQENNISNVTGICTS